MNLAFCQYCSCSKILVTETFRCELEDVAAVTIFDLVIRKGLVFLMTLGFCE